LYGIIYFVDIIFANIIRIIEYLFKILFLIWILINFEKRKISYDCTILIPEGVKKRKYHVISLFDLKIIIKSTVIAKIYINNH
jgi:hypothetical protein